MEAEENMELRDLPVDTRNYTIIDNITGKPIEQSNYSLTIDPSVIGKLNELKRINEEKIRQASLKSQYGDSLLVETYTPENNAVFTPVYEGEYIDAVDYNSAPAPVVEKTQEESDIIKVEELVAPQAEVIQQEGLLDRVVARDPNSIPTEPEISTEELVTKNSENAEMHVPEEQKEELKADNSLFTPEKSALQQASEQIVKIDADKLGPAIKPPKEQKNKKIDLDKMEIKQGKGIAWLAYIIFFLPLLLNRNNRFVRLHANEGLKLNILEILGLALCLPYILLPELTGTLGQLSFVGIIIGVILLGICAISIIPMLLSAMFGVQFRMPWLWSKRIIKVHETR